MLHVAIWPREPAFYGSLSLYWLWHNLTRLPGKYASTTRTPKSRQSLDASSWREIAGAIGNGRKMSSQKTDVTLFRPPRIAIQSHIRTQVTHKKHHTSPHLTLLQPTRTSTNPRTSTSTSKQTTETSPRRTRKIVNKNPYYVPLQRHSHIVEPIARNSETGPDHPIAVERHSFF